MPPTDPPQGWLKIVDSDGQDNYLNLANVVRVHFFTGEDGRRKAGVTTLAAMGGEAQTVYVNNDDEIATLQRELRRRAGLPGDGETYAGETNVS